MVRTAQSFDIDAVRQVIAARRDLPGAMLPILHGIQEALGYVPADTVPMIAEALNVSRAEVHGVISFYHYFRQQAAGQHVVQLCRAEACQAMGGEALARHAQQALGCGFHETSADGQFTLEPVYCLGLCGCGPSLTVDGESHGRMNALKLDRLLLSKRVTS